MQLKSFFQKKYIIWYVLFVFAVVYFSIALMEYRYEFVNWDEAVYVGIGKYLYSGGHAGFFEFSRPLLLPLMIGFFWVLGVSPLLLKLFFPVVTLSVVYLTYLLAKRLFKEETVALLGAILLGMTPVFFSFASLVMSDMFSLLFVLFSLLLALKGKYVWGGVVGGMGILMRFPAGIVIPIVFAYLLVLVFFFRLSWKEGLKRGFSFAIPAFLVVLPFLVFNFFSYYSDTGNAASAALRPFLQGVDVLYHHGVHVYAQSWYYYFVEYVKQNVLLVFFLVGLFFAGAKRDEEHVFILIAFVLCAGYWSTASHKEMRYALAFLPFLAILAGFGIHSLVKKIKYVLPAVFVISVLLFGFSVGHFFQKSDVAYRQEFSRGLFSENMAGVVVATTPYLVEFTDSRILFSVYPLTIKKFLRVPHESVFYTESSLMCDPDDARCVDMRSEITKDLWENNQVIRRGVYGAEEYFVFAPGLPDTQEGLPVRLSEWPQDKLQVMLLLNEFPSLEMETGFQTVWKEEAYQEYWRVVDEEHLTVSVGFLPSHLKRLNGSMQERLLLHDLVRVEEADEEKEIRGRGKNDLSASAIYLKAPLETESDLGYGVCIGKDSEVILGCPLDLYANLNVVKVWPRQEVKSMDELERELEGIRKYDEYAIVPFYYFFNGTPATYFKGFTALVEDDAVMSVGEYVEWKGFRSSVSFTQEGSRMVIIGSPSARSEQLTLLFFSSGNYTIDSSYPTLTLKNRAGEEIAVCLNDVCSRISPLERLTVTLK